MDVLAYHTLVNALSACVVGARVNVCGIEILGGGSRALSARDETCIFVYTYIHMHVYIDVYIYL